MKITLYKKAPICPKCGSSLTYDSDEPQPAMPGGVCQSGYSFAWPAKIYRCHKCGDLYKVEDD